MVFSRKILHWKIYIILRGITSVCFLYQVGSAGKSADADEWYPDKAWSLFRLADYGYGRITVANETHMLYEFVQNRLDKVVDSVWIVKD